MQGLPHPHESRAVEVEPAAAQPARRLGVGGRDREVAGDHDPPSVAGHHRFDPARPHRHRPVARQEAHPAFGEEPGHPAADRRGMGLGDLAGLRDQGDLHPIRSAGPIEEGAEPVAEGERQLRPSGPAPDHRDPEPPPPRQAVALGLGPAFPEGADRLHPEGVLLRPVDVAQGRLRADVEGEEVEADRGPPGRDDLPPLEVDPGRRGVDDPRVREAGELPEVDVRLFG